MMIQREEYGIRKLIQALRNECFHILIYCEDCGQLLCDWDSNEGYFFFKEHENTLKPNVWLQSCISRCMNEFSSFQANNFENVILLCISVRKYTVVEWLLHNF